MTPPEFPPPEDIVIFQPQFVEFGGEERVILALSNGLHAQGKPHSVLCYHDGINLARHASQALRVYQLAPPANPLRRVLALRAALARLEIQGNPVPVLFNIQSALHAGLGQASRYHLRIPDTYRLLGLPADGSPRSRARGMRQRASGALTHWGTRQGIARAQGFITNTRALSDEMQALYGRTAEVIYLGGFGGPLAAAPARAPQPLQLLTVSRLQASKRVDWVLEALASLARAGEAATRCHLHVVGTGPARDELVALCQQLGLAQRVSFHGFVDDGQLADLYAQAHVFVMPAVQGYGLPAIEALYRRQALVVSEESGVVELLGGTPWVAIARGGREGFARALQDMLARVSQPGFFEQAGPALPTEASWARRLIGTLGW